MNIDLPASRYCKPNQPTLCFININSNHFSIIMKQIPDMIGKRITEQSSSHEAFFNAAPACNQALHINEFSGNFKYRLDNKSALLNS